MISDLKYYDSRFEKKPEVAETFAEADGEMA